MAQDRGFDRLVNFSDAIVAIAATLLVLPLVDKASAIGNTPIPEFLRDNAISFVVFVLSFVVIGRFWLAHHRFFDHLKSFSPGLMLFNLLWLLGIVFLPFPTELIVSGHGVTSLAAAVYIGTMLFISIANLGMAIVARRNGSLIQDSEKFRKAYVLSVTTTVVTAIAFFISWVWPMIGLWSLWLLVLSPILGRLSERFEGKRAKAGSA
ncbi:MAG: hypothetical protein RLZZ600_1016 [Actinomycetota bacterium]|jgi:uncharacterized membrane protein